MTTTQKKTDAERLDQIGRTAYAAILAEVEALSAARAAHDDDAEERATETIREGALSVLVRDGWRDPGPRDPNETDGPEEYEVLITTGGPAVRIRGKLGRWCEPETAALEVQDWWLPWTEYREADPAVLLAWVACFCFGD